VKLLPDRRQRDVDDRQIGNRHEERNGKHGKRAPTMDLFHLVLP
jgi:hypothetical protein